MIFDSVAGGFARSGGESQSDRVSPFFQFSFGVRFRMGKMIGFALLCLAVSMPLSAADLKIGFVNVAKLLERAPQAEKAKQELEREFAPRDKRLVSEQKEIKRLEEKLAKDAAVMSDGERQKLDKDIISRKREAKRLQDEFREDFNLRRNEELAQLQKEIFEAIQRLAKEESFDLLLTDGVVYARESVDVTSKVAQKLEQSFKR